MKKEIYTLALGIALLPPIWAVLAPHIGITTGAVALICAALYVVNGNKSEDGLKMSIGFICGDLWAVVSLRILNLLKWNEDLELFFILFVMGALAVIFASLFSKYIFLPSWLCGWAIGLTIMGSIGADNINTLPLEIAIAMLVGVWYVGAGVNRFQRILMEFGGKK